MLHLKLITCMLLLGLISCQEFDDGYDQNQAVDFVESAEGGSSSSVQLLAGLKFKHGGCVVPAGICIFIPIGNPKPETPKPLWSISQEEEGWGSAYLEVKGDFIKITPLRQAHDDDGIVPITDDIEIDPEIAEALGFSEMTILAGEYEIDLGVENEFGEFYVSFFTIKDDII